ncbi:GNAT family N-acetyltransferase [Ornithinibacillus bavariensis]|uniref:GNAT family N-acetyltransferase n=1 Tax=Ornithinibacillus bavariensis TaxID=545502 RepID=UPI000EDDB870|nr:GNAT family N-acetyltransferase [Ornithinibacillus sp.]
MIVELDKTDFGKCRKLLNEQGHLEAKAIVENINPGRIFVNDSKNPTSGLIWLGNNDGFILFGSEKNDAFNNEINHYIDNVIKPEARKVQLKWFEVVGNHEKWNKVIESVFEHRKIESWIQRVYTMRKGNFKSNSVPAIEEGYRVIRICNTLFENKNNTINNIEFLQSKVLAYWSSPEIFLRNGIGYCILYNNEIVSVCFSGFVAGNEHCIDIETLEAHQGKKLAQTVAYSFVKDCFENHLVPYWDCMEMNKPSVAVAENIGFKNKFNYVGYYFSLE